MNLRLDSLSVRFLLSALAGASLAACVLLFASGDLTRSSASPGMPLVNVNRWGANYFPNLPVVTHDGRTYRFYDDLIKGRIVVVNFIYASCTDVCSLATARLAQVREKLGDRVGRDIFFYSITIDPVTDGPEVLKKYASNFYDGPGWLFLTGAQENIDVIRRKLGERSRSLGEHRTDLMLGNEATGEWGRNSIFTDVDALVQTILEMDPKERERMRAPQIAGAADKMLDASAPGQALFMKACSSCHSIGEGRGIGPDLAHVTKRRERDWLVSFITDPGRMIRSGDPTATALMADFGGLKMPRLGLSPTDIDDVLTFIAARSEHRPDAAPQHVKAEPGAPGAAPPTR